MKPKRFGMLLLGLVIARRRQEKQTGCIFPFLSYSGTNEQSETAEFRAGGAIFSRAMHHFA